MKLHSFSVGVAAALVAALGACGGSSGTDGQGGGTTNSQQPPTGNGAGAGSGDQADAGPPAPPPPDHGAPSETYPAFKPDMPQLVNGGKGGLANPKIVTVTWPGDPDADKLEQFGDKIGGTKYWASITSEYGVGAAMSGAENHIRMTTALPASVGNADLDAIVTANATQQTVGGFAPDGTKWPAPTTDTIYVLYIPPTTNLMYFGQEVCQQRVGGYHEATRSGHFVYAVVPPCSFQHPRSDESTAAASHEIAEAALDPQPGDGWGGVDDEHAVWMSFMAGNVENGDLCEIVKDAFYKEPGDANDFNFLVQRQWSNKNATEGHSPCVPQATPYFNTTVLDPTDVTVDLSAFGGSSKQPTHGIHIGVGETKTFAIGFYSDGKMDPWNIHLYEGSPFSQQPTSNLALSVDKSSGQNGEKAYVTVTVNKAGKGKRETMYVASSNSTLTHYMPVLISSN